MTFQGLFLFFFLFSILAFGKQIEHFLCLFLLLRFVRGVNFLLRL